MSRDPAPLPVLRAAFEATGSGCWVMRSILEAGLDRAHGYRLELSLGDDRVRGRSQATEARLIAGEVDVIDTDWLSLSRHRRAGLPLAAAVPYGAIFGGLIAASDGPVRALADLVGRRIGVVHAGDKNWLLLRAACRRLHGFDPAGAASCIAAGSKTALAALLAEGGADAALLYWHQVPGAIADGRFIEVCDLLDLLPSGAAGAPPSTFFVFQDALLAARPDLVKGFADSVVQAIARLRGDAAAWHRASGAPPTSSAALRSKWLARVGLPWRPAMAAELQALAAELADAGCAGAPLQLPPGVFAAGFLQ